jgi:hypothetical protein
MKSTIVASSDPTSAFPDMGNGVDTVEPIKQTISPFPTTSSGVPDTDGSSSMSSNQRRRMNNNGRFGATTSTNSQSIPERRNLGKTVTSFTDETSSDGAFSARSSDNGQAYEIIEYDYDEDANVVTGENGTKMLNIETDDTSEILAEVVGKTAVINIDDNSPAAEALRANAKIHVSSVGKAARAVQLQSVRRVLKRATGITKSGNKKGKPPRIPPTLLQRNKIVSGTGPIDVDHYLDAAGEFTDHSNNQDAIVEGIDEDNDDMSLGKNVDKTDLCEMNHAAHSQQQQEHQYGIDEPSFSEIGGDRDEINMDESQSSKISLSKHLPKPTLHSTPLLHQSNEKLPASLDRDMMHIPDGVAPGTVEAGKKGRIRAFFSSY